MFRLSKSLLGGGWNGPFQTIDNTGLMEAGPGGNLTMNSPILFPGYTSGRITNSGIIAANGGTVTLDTTVQQTAAGKIEITNNGTVNLAEVEVACVEGGTIAVPGDAGSPNSRRLRTRLPGTQHGVPDQPSVPLLRRGGSCVGSAAHTVESHDAVSCGWDR